MDERPTVAHLLRGYREAAGLTQEELAERAGLSARAVSDLERGERLRPHPSTVRMLATALALAPADFVALADAAHRHIGTPRGASGAATAAPTGGIVPRGNLPSPLTSFIGREREMIEVAGLLASTRLLTLTGTGGCGKTRLAIRVADERAGTYPDGVWLVDLEPLSDPALVAQAVLRALRLREHPGQSPSAALVAHVATKRPLLVLDNCEHLLDACARLADTLLRACPHVRLLATSREPLGVAGEATWQVPSLATPPPGTSPAPHQALAYGAIRLFVERARLVRPGFALTDGNCAAVARLCRHLDGIPLAIELASAWVRALSVEQIELRLADRFGLLTGGSRTALRRHQTLRGAIDWSYDLLSASERALFRRLSVFAGGWTLEAAEAVCADGEAGHREIAPEDVLDLLTHLVDKCLALAEDQTGTGRYRLLETIRQYADEKLEGSGEKAAVRSRHRDWYMGLAEQAWSALYGPNESVWLDRLAIDHDNLRAALEWCGREERDVEAALRLAGMLTFSWATRGYLTDGQTQLAIALSMEGAPRFPAAWARALWGAALLSYYRGNLAAARSLGEQALGIRRSLGDQAGIIQSLKDLGLTVYEQGDFHAARAYLEEAAALSRGAGDEPNTATSLDRLAAIAHATGDLPAAAELYAESSAIRQRLGYDWGRAWSFFNMGCVAFDQGDHSAARRLLRESLALSRADSNQDRMIRLLDVLAAVDVAEGQPARAVRLAGAASALREAGGLRAVRLEHARSVRALDLAGQALGEGNFAAAWAEGRELSLEQAAAIALQAEAQA